MLNKPQIVVLTKNDVTEVRELSEKVTPLFEELGYPVFSVSAITGDGIKELINTIGSRLDQLRDPDA